KNAERKTPIAKTTPEPLMQTPKIIPSRIEIENGTTIAGLAFRVSQILETETKGFDVIKVGNAPTRGFTHTIIYDLTNGKKSAELKKLQTFLKSDATLTSSGWLKDGTIIEKELPISSDDVKQMVTATNIDFLIILGENSQNLVLK
ncbi:MAG: LytR C-terminal domain-containing protein, partial [Patescibacteria group bacterium]